jgi:hypothetical protein
MLKQSDIKNLTINKQIAILMKVKNIDTPELTLNFFIFSPIKFYRSTIDGVVYCHIDKLLVFMGKLQQAHLADFSPSTLLVELNPNFIALR